MNFIELVTRSQNGDMRAYGELVGRFQGMAFGYAYHLLGDFHLAQDAAQEAFLEGYRHVASIRDPRAWPVWLRRVVFKHCDRLRRRRRLVTVPLEEGTSVLDETPPADRRLEREEMGNRINAALDILTEEERAIAILSAMHRYRHREIGEFLEIPVNTVKNRLRSMRRKLSERMLEMTRETIREETPTIPERIAEIDALGDACKSGDIARATNLLQKHPDVLDGPDRDTRFPYPGSRLWSPLYLAAKNGHGGLVNLLLDMGANPVPYEVAAQYHQWTYEDWMDGLCERGHDAIAKRIETAIAKRYGPPVDDANLPQAIRDGDTDRVRALLRENPGRVRQADAVGNTPLHWAIAKNDLELTRLLIENGAPVDACNGDGRTPSVVALFGFHRYWCYEEKPEILDCLLKNGAQYTILIAATVGDIDRVRERLKEDPARANEYLPCYRRPLSAAAGKGDAEIVRILLENGADPNAKETICQGGLSLRIAAGKGYRDVVRLLLDYGAVPEHWIDSSGDAVYAAHSGGHKEILQMLYAHGGTMELKVYAAAHRIDVIAEVLHLQPDKADEVFPYGWNDNGSEDLAYDIMHLAIRYGARFENASAWNLRWTVSKYPKVFRLLQEHGANPDLPLLGIAGDMPRRWPDPAHQLKTIAFLVEECGANVNYRDKEGFTPLAGAASEGYEQVVDYLLTRGAEANPDVPEWAKPRYLAEKNGHAKIAETLRQNGATA